MSKPVQKGSLSISTETRNIPLSSNLRGVSYYQECAIENRTGKTVYVMKCDGSIVSIPTLSSRAFDPVLVIKVLTRDVRTDQYGFMRDVSDPRERTLTSYTLQLAEFTERPLFIRELGVVVGVRCDPDEMGQYHPCADKFYDVRFTEALNAGINAQKNNPLRFFINTYDTSINTMYVVINGQVMGCDTNHIGHMQEGIWLTMRLAKSAADTEPASDEALRTYSITDSKLSEIDIECFEFSVGDNSWIIGTDRAAVVKAAKEKAAKLDKSFTQQEMDDRIQEEIRQQASLAEDLRRQVEELKKENEIRKNRIKMMEEEASQSDRQLKLELEQIKLRSERERYLTDLSKQESEREKLMIANQNERLRLELEQLKASVEREKVSTEYSRQNVEREKLNVERYKFDESVAQSKADTVTGYVKAATVIAPAVITIGTLAARSLGKVPLLAVGGALLAAGYQWYQSQKNNKRTSSKSSKYFIDIQ